MLFPRRGGNMLKNTKDIIFYVFFLLFPSVGAKIFFFPMEAIRYSCPIQLVPTYILPAKDIVPTFILPAKEIRLWEKFQPDSFKAERLLFVETDA